MNKNMECGNITKMPKTTCGDYAFKRRKYTFKDKVCLRDGVVFGKVVKSTNELITVKVESVKKYMKERTINFVRLKNNHTI